MSFRKSIFDKSSLSIVLALVEKLIHDPEGFGLWKIWAFPQCLEHHAATFNEKLPRFHPIGSKWSGLMIPWCCLKFSKKSLRAKDTDVNWVSPFLSRRTHLGNTRMFSCSAVYANDTSTCTDSRPPIRLKVTTEVKIAIKFRALMKEFTLIT